MSADADSETLSFDIAGVRFAGDLSTPASPSGLVLFAHGSGSSRLSPRNRAVANALNKAGLATVLFDLLDEREASRRELVFDVPLLARRLELVTRWATSHPQLQSLPIGYFGASTGAAVALRAAAELGEQVAVVDGAGHLFEEPGALERVGELAIAWLQRYLTPQREESLSGVG